MAQIIRGDGAHAQQKEVVVDVRDVARYLVDHLGEQMTSTGVGLLSPKLLRDWVEGSKVPAETRMGRLIILKRAAEVVIELHDDETARTFLRTAVPSLGDRSPLLLIARSAADDHYFVGGAVMHAVNDFVQ